MPITQTDHEEIKELRRKVEELMKFQAEVEARTTVAKWIISFLVGIGGLALSTGAFLVALRGGGG